MSNDQIVAAVCAALACGCAGGGATPAHVVRDSAGLEIVESVRPAWPQAAAWRVAPQPTVRIGVMDGEAAYQFSDITGAVRLADGTIAVADGGSQQVRFFDPSGRFLRAVGRPGGGPGEFTGLSMLGPGPAGGVWAYDFVLRRLTWLDPSGAILRLTTLGPEPPMLNALGALPDGSFVLKELWGARRVAQANQTGTRRDPVASVRFDSAGVLLDSIGLFPGREIVLTEERGRGVMTMPVFGHNSVGAILGDDVIVGATDRFELDVYSPASVLQRRIRIMDIDLAVRPADVQAAIDARVAAAPEEQRAALRAQLEAHPRPTTRPAHGGLRADRAGHLWVAEWRPGPELPQRWTVLAPDGRWLGDVRMPAGVHPWDIAEDWILGVATDSLDVESVVLYPLLKPEH